MSLEFHDFVGFSGAIFMILAYCLLQIDKLSSASLTYSLLNLLGALFILFSLFFSWNLSAFFIEIVWIGISIYGVMKWYNEANTRKNES